MPQSDIEIPRRWSMRGQWRYQCPILWPNGGKCEFDTHDPALIVEHISQVHQVEKQAQATSIHLFGAGDAKAVGDIDLDARVDATTSRKQRKREDRSEDL